MNKLTTVDKSTSLLDVLTFDITRYFDSNYRIINTEDTPAVQIVDYERILEKYEFEVFDTLHLMVMSDKFFVTSDTHINATFLTKNRKATLDEIKKITNYFHELYGLDDSKHKKWTKTDTLKIKNYTFNRIWPTGMGDSFLKLAFKKDTGFEVSILFLNNLLDNLGKKITFN